MKTTAQNIFNKVVKHLLTQKKRAIKPATDSMKPFRDTVCAYRNAEGLSCAVGCLLSEKEAARADALSEQTVEDVLAAKIAPRLVPHLTLLKDLQRIHDTREVHTWWEALVDVATRYNLKMPQ